MQRHRQRDPWFDAVTFFAAACLAVAGCGSNGRVPATGIVLLDGEPLPQAKVTFAPAAGTAGAGGMAITDVAGRFELFTPQGETGLPPGSYRVTVNKAELKGAFEEGIAVTDADVKELLPPRYSDPVKTELTQTVETGAGQSMRLELTSERTKQ